MVCKDVISLQIKLLKILYLLVFLVTVCVISGRNHSEWLPLGQLHLLWNKSLLSKRSLKKSKTKTKETKAR